MTRTGGRGSKSRIGWTLCHSIFDSLPPDPSPDREPSGIFRWLPGPTTVHTDTDRSHTVTSTIHFHVGHNLAGYLPESDVTCFDSWADAVTYLAADMRDYAGTDDDMAYESLTMAPN